MNEGDNLEIISNNILDNLKNDGIEPKLDNSWIEKKLKDIWDNPSIIDIDTDYLESAPTIEDLEKDMKEIAQTAANALEKAEIAYLESMGLHKKIITVLNEVTELYSKTKKLEEKISDSQERLESIKSVVSLMNWLVVGGLIVIVIAFAWWIIDDCNFRWTKTEQLNQEISRIEQKIIEYDSKIDSFTDFSSKNSELNDDYITSKVEAEINKAMLEFYKSQ